MAATIVLTWTSVLASIGGTWYFAQKTFNTTFVQKQKEIARVAVRRPMEIARGMRSLQKYIEDSARELLDLKGHFPEESGRLVLKHNFRGIAEAIKLVHGHLLSSIDDWFDLIGDEIRAVAIFEKQFEDIKELHEKEMAELRAEQAQKEKELELEKQVRTNLEQEKASLQKEYQDKLEESRAAFNKRIRELMREYDLKIPPTGSIGAALGITPSPYIGYSGYGPGSILSETDDRVIVFEHGRIREYLKPDQKQDGACP
jgi:hypothetical protein